MGGIIFRPFDHRIILVRWHEVAHLPVPAVSCSWCEWLGGRPGTCVGRRDAAFILPKPLVGWIKGISRAAIAVGARRIAPLVGSGGNRSLAQMALIDLDWEQMRVKINGRPWEAGSQAGNRFSRRFSG